MFVFKRRTLVRLTRLMLSFYIMFYYMSFTVCAEENPVSDMMVSQTLGMMNQSMQSMNNTEPAIASTDQSGNSSQTAIASTDQFGNSSQTAFMHANQSMYSYTNSTNETLDQQQELYTNGTLNSNATTDSNSTVMNSNATEFTMRSGNATIAANGLRASTGRNVIRFGGQTTGELMQMICNRSEEINNADNTVIVLQNNLQADDEGRQYISQFAARGVNINTSSLTIDGGGNTIMANDTYNTGSLLYLDGQSFSGVNRLVITNLTFQGARSSGADGGGLYIDNLGNDTIISGCKFIDNQGKNGGAVYVANVQEVSIVNCTFNNNTGDFGRAIYSDNTPGLTIKGNSFIGNDTNSEFVKIADPDSTNGEMTYNAILGARDTDNAGGVKICNNWYGSTGDDYRYKPDGIGGNRISESWIYLDIVREVDESNGNYTMTAYPMIYNGTTDRAEYDYNSQLPTIVMSCNSLYGASFVDGSTDIILKGSECKPAVFSVDANNTSYGVQVKLNGTGKVLDFVYTRSLDVDSNGQTIDYVPAGEYAAIPMENNEIIPHKVLENQNIMAYANISYRGTNKNCTFSNVPIQCSAMTEDGLFNMSLADEYVVRGDHNVTFSVDGFGTAQKILHIDKTQTFVKCVNGTYNGNTISASTPSIDSIDNFKQGEGGAIRVYAGNVAQDIMAGKVYFMNGTSDITETDKILSETNVTASKQFAELNLDTLNKGSYDLIAVYHDNSTSPKFSDSNTSARALTFSVKGDASVSVLGGSTSISKVVGSDSFGLNATVGDMGTSGTGTWKYTSSDEDVVTVSNNGTVTIKGSGNAYVTVQYESDTTIDRVNVAVNIINKTNPGSVNNNPTDDGNNNDNDGSDSKQPTENDYEIFMNELKAAAKRGVPETVVLNWGNSLSYEAMNILKENPQLTLIFNFKWRGVDYSTAIGGGNRVIANKSIPWYGPDYILVVYGANAGRVNTRSSYRGSAGNVNDSTARYYVVLRGDSLWRIARKLNVTVNYLVQKNNIRNKNMIHPGQKIYY